MSKYTTQLRWIVEQTGSGLPVPDGQHFANAVYKYIGLDEYPIFDETYRKGLNDKIIEHFYFREIGFETAAQFAFYLRRTMNEIMPKYNKMYQAQLTINMQDALYDYYMNRDETYSGHDDDDTEFQKQGEKHEGETATRDATTTNDLTELDTKNLKDKITYGKEKQERDARTNHRQVQGTTTTDQDQTNTQNTTRTPNLTETVQDSYQDRNVYEDTPMGLLANQSSPSIANVEYATNVTYDDHLGNSTTHDTGTETTATSGSNTNDVSVTESTIVDDVKGGTYTTANLGSDTTDHTGTDTLKKTGTVDLDQDDTRKLNSNDAESGSTQRDFTREYERNVTEKGRRSHSPAWLMSEFAEKWLNIDMMVIRDLEDLFMGLW